MSHEYNDRPSLNEPLPDPLARVADLLGQIELPRSSVSRDELLYRAGWAAAEQQLLGSSRVPKRQVNRLSTVGWSAASALVAMSVTLFVTWPLSNVEPPSEQLAEKHVIPSEPVPADADHVAEVRQEPAEIASTVPKLPLPFLMRSRAYDRSATLLIQRERALRNWQDSAWLRNDMAVSPSAQAAQAAPPRESTPTAREMLKEFLPALEPHSSRSET
jgi:hypothetical protein